MLFLLASCLASGSIHDSVCTEHAERIDDLIQAPNFRTQASVKALQLLLSDSVDPEADLLHICRNGTAGGHYYALIGLLKINSAAYSEALTDFSSRKEGILVEYVVVDRHRGKQEAIQRVLRDSRDVDAFISVELSLPIPGSGEIRMISEPDYLP